jgi:hypothetical protein
MIDRSHQTLERIAEKSSDNAKLSQLTIKSPLADMFTAWSALSRFNQLEKGFKWALIAFGVLSLSTDDFIFCSFVTVFLHNPIAIIDFCLHQLRSSGEFSLFLNTLNRIFFLESILMTWKLREGS